MKTRTRHNAKQTSTTNARSLIFTDDFIEEDYEKVQRLLGISPKSDSKSDSNNALNDDIFSTEAERNAIDTISFKKLSSYKAELNEFKNFIQKKEDLGKSSPKCDKNTSKKGNTKITDTIVKQKATNLPNYEAMRRRDAKQLSKIDKGFQCFFKLICSLNKAHNSQICLHPENEHASCIGKIEESKELHESEIQSHQLETKSKRSKANRIKKLNLTGSNMNIKNDSNSNKRTKLNEAEAIENDENQINNTPDNQIIRNSDQAQMMIHELSNEYIQSRLNYHDFSTEDSVTLVPENVQIRPRLVSVGWYPLNKNQSIHAQIAYYTFNETSRRFYNSQYRLIMQSDRYASMVHSDHQQTTENDQTSLEN